MKKENERFEAVKAMNTLVKSLNDESAYYNHWIYIVPDEASDDDLEYIAEDEELFKDTVSMFLRIMKVYADDGMYIADALYTPDGTANIENEEDIE